MLLFGVGTANGAPEALESRSARPWGRT